MKSDTNHGEVKPTKYGINRWKIWLLLTVIVIGSGVAAGVEINMASSVIDAVIP